MNNERKCRKLQSLAEIKKNKFSEIGTVFLKQLPKVLPLLISSDGLLSKPAYIYYVHLRKFDFHISKRYLPAQS